MYNPRTTNDRRIREDEFKSDVRELHQKIVATEKRIDGINKSRYPSTTPKRTLLERKNSILIDLHKERKDLEEKYRKDAWLDETSKVVMPYRAPSPPTRLP